MNELLVAAPDRSQPSISLIVCTVDRVEPLERLLASLHDQALPPREIIIVDQNEGERLRPLLDAHSSLAIVHVTDLAGKRGLSRARNRGLAAATGDVVGFPDDDCWYGPDVVAKVAGLFRNSRAGVVVGRTTDLTGAESVSPHLPHRSTITRDNVFRSGNSNGLFVRRTLAVEVGGFDESLGVGASTPFQSGEETDFILRCERTGAGCEFEPDLIVYHDRIEDDPAARIKRIRRYSPGYGRVLRIHDYGAAHLGERVVRSTLSGALCFAKGRRDEARERIGWAIGAASGFLAPLRAPGDAASKPVEPMDDRGSI